nr:transposase family protein [Amycolatopsis benzoatilytica]
MTGLDDGQLTDLVARMHVACGDKFVSRGRPIALGLFRSVAMVVCLLRKNVTQDFAGAVFGVSQSTVSRRWDLLRPVIGEVLAAVVPDPREVVGRGTVPVDGTVCPTWDWNHVPDLFSAKVGYPGMNLQKLLASDDQRGLELSDPGQGFCELPHLLIVVVIPRVQRVRLHLVEPQAGRMRHAAPQSCSRGAVAGRAAALHRREVLLRHGSVASHRG